MFYQFMIRQDSEKLEMEYSQESGYKMMTSPCHKQSDFYRWSGLIYIICNNVQDIASYNIRSCINVRLMEAFLLRFQFLRT